MNGEPSKTVKGYFIFFIGFQVLFVLSILLFYGIITVPNPFFRVASYEEWQWFLNYPSWDYDFVVIGIYTLVEIAADLVFLIGILQLYLGRLKTLPTPLSWKISAPLVGALVYAALFLYFKYEAEHYRLYMSLVLPEVLSLVLLALLWPAKKVQGRGTVQPS